MLPVTCGVAKLVPSSVVEAVAVDRGGEADARGRRRRSPRPRLGRAEPLGVRDELVAGVGRGHADRVGDDRGEALPLGLAVEAVAGGGDDRDVQRVELADRPGDLPGRPRRPGEPVGRVVAAVGDREVDGGDVVLGVVARRPTGGPRRCWSKLPWLLSPKTRRATMSAPGATPGSVGSLAAIRPATPVPCCQVGQDAVGAAGEVEAGDDLVARPEAAAEGRVVVVDPGVDHRDGLPGAVDAVGRTGRPRRR